MFTQVRSASRRVSPDAVNGRAVMKAVYVVLEPQYQNALTQAATSLNDQNGPLAIMARMVQEQHLDADLFELFVRAGVYRTYAERFLAADQIDAVDEEALLRR